MCLLRVVNRSSSGGGVGGWDGVGLGFGAIRFQPKQAAFDSPIYSATVSVTLIRQNCIAVVVPGRTISPLFYRQELIIIERQKWAPLDVFGLYFTGLIGFSDSKLLQTLKILHYISKSSKNSDLFLILLKKKNSSILRNFKCVLKISKIIF